MKTLALALAALVLTSASAFAADLAPPAPPPPVAAAPAFSWDGLYAGIYGGYVFSPGAFFNTGISLGDNFTVGPGVVFGLEGQVGAVLLSGGGFGGVQVDLNARVGIQIGAAGRGLWYVESGVGFLQGLGMTWNTGAGLELAIGQSASLFVETKALAPFGLPPALQLQGGLNWHFGQH